MKQSGKWLVAFLGLNVLMNPSRLSLSSGPSIPEAIFTLKYSPDPPKENFIRSRLGILQPTYGRKYLLVAYRNMLSLPVDPTLQKAILSPPFEDPYQKAKDGLRTWTTARESIMGLKTTPPIDPYRRIVIQSPPYQFYYGYLNCTESSFQTAASILENKIKAYGTQNPMLKDWILAQDRVFSNCSSPQQIPSPAKSTDTRLLSEDRNYQIAAAHFYAGKFDVARQQFEEISHDPSSPWSQMAPYLAARALIRKATVMKEDDEFDGAILIQAEHQLELILHDNKLIKIYPQTRRLLNWVLLRTRFFRRLHQLSHALLRSNPDPDVQQDLTDYLFLLDRFTSRPQAHPFINQVPARHSFRRSYPTPRNEQLDALSDWILTFQSQSQSALRHSVAEWKSTHSIPWLVAAISKVHSGNIFTEQLEEAASKVGPQSPAFLTLSFHRARLMIEAGEIQRARQTLDQLISSERDQLSTSALNQLFALRMNVAGNLDDFLTYSQRMPMATSFYFVGIEWDEVEAKYRKPFFDMDSTFALNQEMPLSVLEKAAQSKVLPPHLRLEIALGTWARSILLENDKVSADLVPILQGTRPSNGPISPCLPGSSKSGREKICCFFSNPEIPWNSTLLQSRLSSRRTFESNC